MNWGSEMFSENYAVCLNDDGSPREIERDGPVVTYEAAASHKWAHGSIQPANILILPGVAADGGWPRIKLRNFDLAGLKFRSDENEARELVPPMLPEFSSPEQLENAVVDFRSDVFSL